MTDDFRNYVGDIFVQDGSASGTTGSICWAPVYYTNATVNVVRPLVNDPASPDFGRYTVKSTSLSAIANPKSVPFQHRFPDKHLKLTLGEDLFVVRGKVRPVVVLFNPRQHNEQVVKDGAKSPDEVGMCLGCAPVYTLVDAGGNYTHKPEFVENVRALKYAQYCYLPTHTLLEDGRETFVRLDRVSWYPPDVLSPSGVKLNSIGIDYLLAYNNWLTQGIPLPQALAEARAFFMDLLEDGRCRVEQERLARRAVPDNRPQT